MNTTRDFAISEKEFFTIPIIVLSYVFEVGGLSNALKPNLKAAFTSAVPSYDRRSSGFRRTIVQLYDSCKTQNGHKFGHGHATDL